MNCTKGTHESQKENLTAEKGVWKDRASDGLLMIHASAVHIWSTSGRVHKLQALGSGHEDPEWCGECQVACIDKHTCIDKSEPKSMYWKSYREHRHTIAGKEIVSDIKQGICGFSYLNYSFNVLISQIDNLGLYNWFRHIYFTWYLISCSCMPVLMTRFLIYAFSEFESSRHLQIWFDVDIQFWSVACWCVDC